MELQKATGVGFTCDGRLKADRVVLVVQRRTAREVMERVAAHFGWSWKSEGAGFKLIPTEAFLAKAAKGRAGILVEEGSVWRRLAAKSLEEIPRLDRAALEKQKENVEKEFFRGSSDYNAFHVQQDQLQDLSRQLDPCNRIATAVVANLSDQEIVALADRRLVFSSHPQPFERSLSPGARAVIPAMMADLRRLYTAANESTKEGSVELIPWDDPSRIKIVRVSVRSLSEASVTLLTKDHRVVYTATLNFSGPKQPLTPLPDAVKRVMKPPYDGSVVPESADGNRLRFFGTWMAILGERLKADVIADAYDPAEGAAYTTPEDLMDRSGIMGSERTRKGFVPKFVDGWLSNRDPQWPLQRVEQVPHDLALALVQNRSLKTIDEMAALTSRLTVAQLHSPFGMQERNFYWLHRVWNAASPELRLALRQGRSVPLTALPREALELLYLNASDQSSSATYTYSGGFGEEPEFQIDSATSGEPVLDDPDEDSLFRDTDFASMYPTLLDPKAHLSIQFTEIPAIFDPKFGGRVLHPRRLAMTADPQRNERDLAGRDIFLATTRVLRLKFRLRKDSELNFNLGEVQVGAKVAADRSQWPESLLSRIRYHQERRRDEMRESAPPPP